MAVTDFGALSPAQKVVWAMDLVKSARDKSFFLSNGFVGKNTADMSCPIHRITEFTKTERGDRVIMQLEGNEEQFVNDSQEIAVDRLRHGVLSKGEMADQRAVILFRAQAKDALAKWLADIIDELLHLTLAGRSYKFETDDSLSVGSQLPQFAYASSVVPPSDGRIKYAGNATSESTITANDTIRWNDVVDLSAFAKRKMIKPIRDGGKNYYVLLLSTEQARDLTNDPVYQENENVGTAGARGSKNPLFQNAIAVINGVIIHEDTKTFNTLGADSGEGKWGSGKDVDGAQAILMGSQAAGFAMITEPTMEERKNRQGIGFGQKFGMLKPQFLSRQDGNTLQDFGVVSFKTAAAA